jgi:hypothetical protein
VNFPSPRANLSNRLVSGLKAPAALPLFVALLGPVFLYYSHQRLHHTDLWGHLAYGRLICQTGSIPATEPFMPLARGVPLVDTAWLTQVMGYLAISLGGPTAIQFLHALAIVASLGILAFCIYQRTHSILWAVDGLAIFTALNWYQFQIVRPQMAGLVCFLCVLAIVSAPRWHRWFPAAIAFTFALWANLHGSFVLGLALMGFASLGRAIDVWRRTRRLAAAFRDRRVQRLFLALAAAAAAVLINPYGPKLYVEVFAIPGNPNLSDLLEWHPLPASGLAGEMVTAALLCLVYRLTLRRVPAGEALVLVGLGTAGLLSARMLIWWAPVAAGCLVIHANSVWRSFRPLARSRGVARRSLSFTLVAVGLACLIAAATPLGRQALFGRETLFEQCVSRETPVAAVRWLGEHPQRGQIYNTYEWGDYLVWAGPRDVEVFVTSQAHLVPTEVWRDYLTVSDVSPGWQDILDRYRVETILIDKEGRQALISHLRADRRWQRNYDDEIAVIFMRTIAE